MTSRAFPNACCFSPAEGYRQGDDHAADQNHGDCSPAVGGRRARQKRTRARTSWAPRRNSRTLAPRAGAHFPRQTETPRRAWEPIRPDRYFLVSHRGRASCPALGAGLAENCDIGAWDARSVSLWSVFRSRGSRSTEIVRASAPNLFGSTRVRCDFASRPSWHLTFLASEMSCRITGHVTLHPSAAQTIACDSGRRQHGRAA